MAKDFPMSFRCFFSRSRHKHSFCPCILRVSPHRTVESSGLMRQKTASLIPQRRRKMSMAKTLLFCDGFFSFAFAKQCKLNQFLFVFSIGCFLLLCASFSQNPVNQQSGACGKHDTESNIEKKMLRTQHSFDSSQIGELCCRACNHEGCCTTHGHAIP